MSALIAGSVSLIAVILAGVAWIVKYIKQQAAQQQAAAVRKAQVEDRLQVINTDVATALKEKDAYVEKVNELLGNTDTANKPGGSGDDSK